ncbi:MAG: hypothetical protein AAGA33_15050 [Pseudomonadota bacterium]
MVKRVLKRAAGAGVGVILILYAGLLLIRSGNEVSMTSQDFNAEGHRTVAVFGATGTIGDGLLKAVVNAPDVNRVRVFTRRASPRIEAGVATGKVEMIIHTDYLDYRAILPQLADIDAVFWAIGLSAVGMTEDDYREIHVDYPFRFVTDWLSVRGQGETSFHYVSGSGANAESRMMWAREKARAEKALAELATDSRLRVISYRPAVILPTETEAHLGHRIAYAILSPIKAAVAAESIGQSMLEVSARGPEFPNGTVLESKAITELSRVNQNRER